MTRLPIPQLDDLTADAVLDRIEARLRKVYDEDGFTRPTHEVDEAVGAVFSLIGQYRLGRADA